MGNAHIACAEILGLIARLEDEGKTPQEILEKVSERLRQIIKSSKAGWY